MKRYGRLSAKSTVWCIFLVLIGIGLLLSIGETFPSPVLAHTRERAKTDLYLAPTVLLIAFFRWCGLSNSLIRIVFAGSSLVCFGAVAAIVFWLRRVRASIPAPNQSRGTHVVPDRVPPQTTDRAR